LPVSASINASSDQVKILNRYPQSALIKVCYSWLVKPFASRGQYYYAANTPFPNTEVSVLGRVSFPNTEVSVLGRIPFPNTEVSVLGRVPFPNTEVSVLGRIPFPNTEVSVLGRILFPNTEVSVPEISTFITIQKEILYSYRRGQI
jgi:hypothetical protein